MQLKTHLAIGLAVAFYFLPYVNSKFIFLVVTMVSSLLPNIDSYLLFRNERKSINEMKKENRIIRGFLHSYTFCIGISILLAFVYPILSLPFFLGYSFHLLIDSYSAKGITPFWPFKKKLSSYIKNQGKIDNVIFYIAVFVAFALLIKNVFNM